MKRVLQGLRKKQQEAAKPDAVATAPAKRNARAQGVPRTLDRVLPQRARATMTRRSTRTARGQVGKALREESRAVHKREPVDADDGHELTITVRRFMPKRKGAQ